MAPPIIRSLISLPLNKSSRFWKPVSCYSISGVLFSSSGTQESKSSFSLADHFIEKHNFSHEIAFKTASSLISMKDPHNCDKVISFLKESGFSKSHIEEALKKNPKLLTSSLEKTIKPKFKIFREFEFSTDDVANILAGDPWILSRSLDDKIAPSISYLKSVLGSNADVVKILKSLSWFLAFDLEKTMMPNIEYFRSCGLSSSQIASYLLTYPRLFLHKPESINQFVRKAGDMGVDRKSNMFIVAIRTLSSMTEEKWEQKLKLFRNLGFSEDDIMSTFRMIPQVFSVSERKIKKIADFLLTRNNAGISLIISHPLLLTYSLEHRLKPRLQVIEILENKNLIRSKSSLTTVFKMSEMRFREKYVCPYLSELESVSMGIVDHKC